MQRPVDVVMEIGLNVKAKRGIDYYISHLVEALAERDPRNHYRLFSYFFRDHAAKRAALPNPDKPNFTLDVPRVPESLVRRAEWGFGLPVIRRGLLRGRRVDVYHAISDRLPRLGSAKGVMTFFDLSVETKRTGDAIAAPLTYESAKRAARLIATGDTCKQNLVRYYGIPEERITVITTGVNARLFHPERDPAVLARVREKYGLPADYLVLIGPFEPPQRVNAETILEAFASLRKEGLAAGCKLVLVGLRIPYVETLLELARKLGVGDALMSTGYVDVDDLRSVYGMSLAVVHPTSIEGFGFGNEVMACGAPFVTSNLPGVLEAVADAALTVPPKDAPALSAALKRLFKEPGLADELRRRGLARSALFDYRKIADQHVALYEEVAAGR
jgi:glycosyltransferase involved in cell wall biosynthesis